MFGETDASGATPVPLKLTVNVPASEEIVKTPFAGPKAVGAKTMLYTQLCPGLKLDGQDDPTIRNPAETLVELILTTDEPVLLSVTLCAALTVFTNTSANARDEGVTVADAGESPVPESGKATIP